MAEPQTNVRIVDAVFSRAAEAVQELTGCDRVLLVSVRARPGSVSGLVMEFGESPRFTAVRTNDVRQSGAQAVLDRHQVQVLFRKAPPDLPAEEQRLCGQGYREWVYLPMIRAGEILGVLGLASRKDGFTEQWTLPRLTALAGLVALALHDPTAHAPVAELQRLQQEVTYLRDEIRTDRDLRSLTGESPAMKAVRLAIQQVARTDSTVLIQGETGTGKELVARGIHQLSPRREQLLVSVNCAALAPGVIASELFGHEQGAFTGATRRRIGRFELAHRGTIFLDEIGELPPETQVLLLRVLQERALERVGGQVSIPVDVRVIAATHRDLAAATKEGRFRADLYFRLNVFPIHVPPLRDRREDIPDLVRHFIHHFNRRMNRSVNQVSPAGLRLFLDYDWPGNVRELENLVERAMIVASGEVLEVDPHWLTPAAARSVAAPSPFTLAEQERRTIQDALAKCDGRIYGPGGAAALLGLKPTTLYGKMRKHGIARKPRPG
jgi:formate hydrogenlyase transcriptional activator